MEAATATSTETCKTCGQAFDPELDDNCDIIEIEVSEDETEEGWACGHCAPRPTGRIEWKDGVPWWVEAGEWVPFKLH